MRLAQLGIGISLLACGRTHQVLGDVTNSVGDATVDQFVDAECITPPPNARCHAIEASLSGQNCSVESASPICAGRCEFGWTYRTSFVPSCDEHGPACPVDRMAVVGQPCRPEGATCGSACCDDEIKCIGQIWVYQPSAADCESCNQFRCGDGTCVGDLQELCVGTSFLSPAGLAVAYECISRPSGLETCSDAMSVVNERNADRCVVAESCDIELGEYSIRADCHCC